MLTNAYVQIFLLFIFVKTPWFSLSTRFERIICALATHKYLQKHSNTLITQTCRETFPIFWNKNASYNGRASTFDFIWLVLFLKILFRYSTLQCRKINTIKSFTCLWKDITSFRSWYASWLPYHSLVKKVFFFTEICMVSYSYPLQIQHLTCVIVS